MKQISAAIAVAMLLWSPEPASAQDRGLLKLQVSIMIEDSQIRNSHDIPYMDLQQGCPSREYKANPLSARVSAWMEHSDVIYDQGLRAPDRVIYEGTQLLVELKAWHEELRERGCHEWTVEEMTEASMPAVEVTEMDETYYAVKPSNVRSGPGTEFDKVGRLSPGDEIRVTGKVKGKNWYRIAMSDGKVAFVFAFLLSDRKPAEK